MLLSYHFTSLCGGNSKTHHKERRCQTAAEGSITTEEESLPQGKKIALEKRSLTIKREKSPKRNRLPWLERYHTEEAGALLPGHLMSPSRP